MRKLAGLVAVILGAALVPRVIAEDGTPATRQLWDDAFRRARAEVRQKTGSTGAAYLGLTVWRLRRAAAQTLPADSVRLPLDGEDWWAESVDAGTRFAPGERLRLGVESARRGYLYVIDTEENANGSQAEPRLVFPTTRTRGGDNRVTPGRLVEIPDLADTPPYFSLRRSHEGHVADVLTIFVTPHPLEGIRPGREPLPVSKEQLARWQRTYGAPASRLGLSHGQARTYTHAEHEAASSATRVLTHDDPLPQTLFRVDSPAGGGIWVQVSLGVFEEETAK
jgi:hypothetical protein